MGLAEFIQLIAGLEWSALFLALLCFLALTFSAYIKIATVLAIVRSGFGLFGLPSVFVTTGLSLALTYFVMAPTLEQAATAMDGAANSSYDARSARATQGAVEVWREYVLKHVDPAEQKRFGEIANRLQAENGHSTPENSSSDITSSWRILAPSFMVTQLKAAFATGLSILLPLLIVELLIANVLVAVGLSQLDPSTVSLPFKLILFVMVDGWTLITTNLVASFGGG